MSKHPAKILIAEDDIFLRKVYVTKLTKEGFDVTAAADGEEALTKIRQVKPDLALLDLVMPVMTGFDVLETMAADEKLSHIPVIVVSNLGQASDIRRAEELGVKDYLIKSNNSIAATVEKIRAVLKRSQAGETTDGEPAGEAAPTSYKIHLKANFGDYQRLLIDFPWLKPEGKEDLILTLQPGRSHKFTATLDSETEEK